MDVPAGYRWRTRDAALRMADLIALHQTALSFDELLAGRYVAIQLADGRSDGVAYDTREQAIAHQRHNGSRCIYLRIPMERLNPQTCDTILWYGRSVYDAGHREDPAHQLIIPTRTERL
jgi:hypothetical protein